jgi:hypothetical protein
MKNKSAQFCKIISSFIFPVFAVVFLSFTLKAEDNSPLLKKLDIKFSESNLEDTIKYLTSNTGVDFMVGSDVALPKEFMKRKFRFDVRGMTVVDISEWVARSLDTRYRIYDNNTTIEFTSSYDWLGKIRPKAQIYNTGGLLDWGRREEFMAVLNELLKVYMVRGAEYNIRLNEKDQRLIAYLPIVLHRRLSRILSAMSAVGEKAVARDIDKTPLMVTKKLALFVPMEYHDCGFDKLLNDLAFQGNINIGVSAHIRQKCSKRKFTCKPAEMPFSDALRSVCDYYGLYGYVVDNFGNIWLSEKTVRNKAGTRRLLWKDIKIRSYRAVEAVEEFGIKRVEKELRNFFTNDALEDPSVSLAYHYKSGNIIVAAPEEEQLAIEDCLYRIYMRIDN